MSAAPPAEQTNIHARLFLQEWRPAGHSAAASITVPTAGASRDRYVSNGGNHDVTTISVNQSTADGSSKRRIDHRIKIQTSKPPSAGIRIRISSSQKLKSIRFLPPSPRSAPLLYRMKHSMGESILASDANMKSDLRVGLRGAADGAAGSSASVAAFSCCCSTSMNTRARTHSHTHAHAVTSRA